MKLTDITFLDYLSLNREEVIKCISNTFNSKVISNDTNWTIIEIEWKRLTNEGILLKMLEDVEDNQKVYIYLISSDDKYDWSVILRSKNNDTIEKTANNLVSKGGVIKNDKKTIIDIGKTYAISFSKGIIDPYESISKDGHLINTIFNLEINLDKNEPISYYFDLLIGTNIKIG